MSGCCRLPVWFCTTYTAFRILASVFDTATDAFHAYHLYIEDHIYWGSLTLAFLATPWIVSIINCIVAKCCNGRGEQVEAGSVKLIFGMYAEIFEAFFESGPELILHLVIVLNAVHIKELKELSPWGILSLIGIVSSLMSLLISCIRYSQEPVACSCRFLTFCWTILASVVFRVTAAATLFYLQPHFSVIVIVILYFTNLVMYSLFGENFLDNLVHAYYGMWAPIGYAQLKRHAVGYVGEASAGCIHRKKLPRKIKMFHVLNMATNVLLVAPLVTLTLLYPPGNVPLLDQLGVDVDSEFILLGVPLAALLATAPSLVYLGLVTRRETADSHW